MSTNDTSGPTTLTVRLRVILVSLVVGSARVPPFFYSEGHSRLFVESGVGFVYLCVISGIQDSLRGTGWGKSTLDCCIQTPVCRGRRSSSGVVCISRSRYQGRVRGPPFSTKCPSHRRLVGVPLRLQSGVTPLECDPGGLSPVRPSSDRSVTTDSNSGSLPLFDTSQRDLFCLDEYPVTQTHLDRAGRTDDPVPDQKVSRGNSGVLHRRTETSVVC